MPPSRCLLLGQWKSASLSLSLYICKLGMKNLGLKVLVFGLFEIIHVKYTDWHLTQESGLSKWIFPSLPLFSICTGTSYMRRPITEPVGTETSCNRCYRLGGNGTLKGWQAHGSHCTGKGVEWLISLASDGQKITDIWSSSSLLYSFIHLANID